MTDSGWVTFYEYTIPNEMIPDHLELIQIHASYEDMPVLEFCQNMLMRRV
jgi:hypothetical protein